MAGLALPHPLTLGKLCERHGGVVDQGAEGRVLHGVAPIDKATENDLAPLLSRRYLEAAHRSPAALLVASSLAEMVPAGGRWIHPYPTRALALLLEALAPPPPRDARSLSHIDPRAEVHPTAVIGVGVVIAGGVTVGADSRIEPHAVIYGGTIVGERVVIGAGSVIGRPGFGWVTEGLEEGAAPMRIPQLGGVRLEDDVELGALCTVDAGTLSPTTIRRGAKLDAHVHVGHNVTIGRGSIVAAQAGFAGSVELGDGVLVGGQAGVSDHVHVGAGARIAAKAGVIGDVKPGAVVAGYPAVDRARWLRATAIALREATSETMADTARSTAKNPRGTTP